MLNNGGGAVGLSVLVETFRGERLAESTHSSLNQLVESAKKRGLPLIGDVDPYDTTTFNRSQLGRLRSELEALRSSVPVAEQEAIAELLRLVDVVAMKPHRYLIFNGD